MTTGLDRSRAVYDADGKPIGGKQCTATSKQSGKQCRRRATPGADVCKMHGGKAPQVTAAVKRRKVEEQARAEVLKRFADGGETEVRDPLTELARVAGEIVAFKDYLREQVESLQGTLTYWTETTFVDSADTLRTQATEQVRAVLAAYERALDRTAKVLATMVKLDLQGRLLALQEGQAEQLVAAIRAGLGTVELEATVRQGVENAIAAELERLATPNALQA